MEKLQTSKNSPNDSVLAVAFRNLMFPLKADFLPFKMIDYTSHLNEFEVFL